MKKEMLLELIGLAIEKNGTEGGGDLPFKIGKSYFIRTITYHMIRRFLMLMWQKVLISGAAIFLCGIPIGFFVAWRKGWLR